MRYAVKKPQYGVGAGGADFKCRDVYPVSPSVTVLSADIISSSYISSSRFKPLRLSEMK